MNKKIPNSVNIVDSHLDSFFDKDADIVVFDEIKSEVIHRDIFFIKATNDLPYHILLSCGMSALPMKVPKDIPSSQFAEVMILLPKEWNLDIKTFNDERNYWPIRIMKELMMFPHANKTWLGYGHSYSHQESTEFAKGVGFSAVILVKSNKLSSDFTQIELKNNKVIEIYTLIPLYKEEFEFKKKNSTNELLDKFEKFGIDEIVKIGRRNVCK